MTAVDLCIFLSSYTFVVAVVVTGELFRTRRWAWFISAVVAWIAVAVATTTGFYLKPEESYFELLWFLVKQRDFSAAAAAGLGVASALVWAAPLFERPAFGQGWFSRRGLRRGVAQLVLAASILGVVLFTQAFIWRDILGVRRDAPVKIHAPGFIIEKVADLDNAPIRVAVDEHDHVYVCYDYFGNAGTVGGGIVKLEEDELSKSYHTKIVADSPFLMRCYGLAAKNGELFVSRSGICARAVQGEIQYEDAGAVTRLRDVDGDGYFEFADDVVTGLPGARGPHTMQQNNGICFAPDGSLFVTTASASDRSLADHPWEGVVLRVDAEFNKPEIFARGFRNPFGIVVGPDDEIFVTDNDADENPGDELNHVIRGEHYGHPYVVPNEKQATAEGFREPVLVGPHEWNFLGLVYATSTSLPEKYRDCLYVADFMQRAIWQIRLEKSGDTYRVDSVERFATLTSPIDIAVTRNGDFFVICRDSRNLYRIRPERATSEGVDG